MTTVKPEQILDLARQLSPADQCWLALQLQEYLETTLPDQATLDQAVGVILGQCVQPWACR